MLRHLDKIAFGFGFVALVFIYGVAVGKYELPPYALIDRARDAAAALYDRYFGDKPEIVGAYREGGLIHSDPARMQPGATLIAGYGARGTQAWLIGSEGGVLHEWRIAFSEVWPEAPHIADQGPDDDVIWHGIHLYPNGDLLFNFEGSHFPFGGGLVLLDEESRLKWALPRNTHHDLQVMDDGTIYALAHRYLDEGIDACSRHLEPPYYEDLILEVSPDGEVLDEISILDAMCSSPFQSLFTIDGWKNPVRSKQDDPLHTNAIDIVTTEIADRFPFANEGEMLLSFRNLSTIAVLDPETDRITWSDSGLYIRQHDPDFLDNGNLLIFDNRGSRSDFGISRIIEFNPNTHEIAWVFESDDEVTFANEVQGNQQPLENGNVLITDSYGGRVLEVTRDTEPEIVWEWVNYLEPHDNGGVLGVVNEARRYPQDTLTFLDEGSSP